MMSLTIHEKGYLLGLLWMEAENAETDAERAFIDAILGKVEKEGGEE